MRFIDFLTRVGLELANGEGRLMYASGSPSRCARQYLISRTVGRQQTARGAVLDVPPCRGSVPRAMCRAGQAALVSASASAPGQAGRSASTVMNRRAAPPTEPDRVSRHKPPGLDLLGLSPPVAPSRPSGRRAAGPMTSLNPTNPAVGRDLTSRYVGWPPGWQGNESEMVRHGPWASKPPCRRGVRT